MRAPRRGLLHRAVALLLSWALPATSVPAAAPVAAERREASSRRLAIQSVATYEILAGDRRSPRGVAWASGRAFFTDELEGRLYEVTAPGMVASRVSGLRQPRGLIAEPSGRLLLVAEAAASASGAGLVLRYDPASRAVAVVARGLKHPRGLVRASDGTLFVTAEGLIKPGERDDHRCEDFEREDDQDDESVSSYTGTVFRWSPASGFVAVASGFKRPEGMVVDADGAVLVAAERYRRAQQRLEGSIFRVRGSEVMVHLADRLKRPTGLVRDATGDLYLSGQRHAHRGSDPGLILRLSAGRPPLESAWGLVEPRGLAFTSSADLLAADERAGVVIRFAAAPTPSPTPTPTPPASPTLAISDPTFTNLDPFPLTGTAEPGTQVLVRGGLEDVTAPVAADGSFSLMVPLRHNQTNVLEAVAIRDGVTSAPAGASVVHDDVAPLLSAAADPPANAAGWNRTDVIVSFTCSDGGSGVVSCPAPLPVAGETTGQEVTGAATDRAGNTATARLVVKIDKTGPLVTVGVPEPGFSTNSSSITVSGHVVESNPVSVSVNGVTAEVTGLPPDLDFVARNVPLGPGPEVSVNATAEDVAGNTATTQVPGRLDSSTPRVTISAPRADAYLRGSAVHVTGTVEDDSPTTVDVNGIPALCAGSLSCVSSGAPAVFEADVPVAVGRFTVLATARDGSGNTGNAAVDVFGDSEAPRITVDEPDRDFVTRATSIRVAGAVADASPVTLKLGDTPVSVVDGRFSVDAPLLEGPVRLILEATDAAGNRTTFEIPGLVDRQAPGLEIVLPAAVPEGPTPVGSLPLLVQGLVQEPTSVTVTVDGVLATVTAGEWHASLPSLPEGEHTLVVIATDEAGNSATKTRELIVDLGPPVLTISSSLPPLTREASLTVEGTVEDRTRVTVTVNDVPAAVTGGPGTATFTVTVALADGDNALAIVATDQAGRSTRLEPTVTRDSIAPGLDLLTPEQISPRRPGQATANPTDNLAVGRVVFTLDGSPLGTLTAPPWTVALTVPDGASPGDTLTVAAEAFDTAGNSTRVSHSVRVGADGAIVGQVLSDATGLPLLEATVAFL
ncbi:MAG TPA: Ig-like domain-containing protein, partial [Vicinamibacteria bacterium]